jgi:hypothetical protein
MEHHPGATMASSPQRRDTPKVPPVEVAPSRWSLNLLGVLLVATLAGAVVLSISLWIRLERTRAELAEEAGPATEAPVARSAPAPQPIETPAEPVEAAATPPPAAPAAAPAVEERLVLLLTVGTRHYAEKQLRLLKQKCRASLAVYQQRRGRCAWSTCFAVAAREEDAELARPCGETKGQAVRDRKDFVALQGG